MTINQKEDEKKAAEVVTPAEKKAYWACEYLNLEHKAGKKHHLNEAYFI